MERSERVGKIYNNGEAMNQDRLHIWNLWIDMCNRRLMRYVRSMKAEAEQESIKIVCALPDVVGRFGIYRDK